MGNREHQDRKLLQHQKPIWRKAFEESMKHTSIEGATRNAWKTVDVWERVGAFNESASPPQSMEQPAPKIDFESAWNYLGESLQEASRGSDYWEDRIAVAMDDYQMGIVDLKEFKSEINSILRDPSE